LSTKTWRGKRRLLRRNRGKNFVSDKSATAWAILRNVGHPDDVFNRGTPHERRIKDQPTVYPDKIIDIGPNDV
jgi:hypothetical protein